MGTPMQRDIARFEFEVLESTSISARQRKRLLGLFQANYSAANSVFLEKSLSVLRQVAFFPARKGPQRRIRGPSEARHGVLGAASPGFSITTRGQTTASATVAVDLPKYPASGSHRR
jgi:hypothetical protein